MARKVENWRRIAKLTFWIFTRFKSAFSTYRYLSLPICDTHPPTTGTNWLLGCYWLYLADNDHVVVIFHMRCLHGETIRWPIWRRLIDLPKSWSADLFSSVYWSDQRCWSRFGFSEYPSKPSFCYLSFYLVGGWFFEPSPPFITWVEILMSNFGLSQIRVGLNLFYIIW